jgi:hypothetical protein
MDIRFRNGQKTSGSSRKNINQGIKGHYLWASFKFLYRSTSDLRAAGFDTFENSPNPTSNGKANRSTNLATTMDQAGSTATRTANEKPILPSNRRSELSPKRVFGPVGDANNAKHSNHLDYIKEEATGYSSNP